MWRDDLREYGFAKIPSGIPEKLLADATRAVLQRVSLSATDQRSRDGHANPKQMGFVPLWNDEVLWEIRSQPGIYELFCTLYGTASLWVSLDRCHYKPPYAIDPEAAINHFLHWDAEIRRTPDVPFQGVLALDDTSPQQGAFTCAPSIYKDVIAGNFERAEERFRTGLYDLVTVGCARGDFILWDYRLLHGNSANLSDRSRLAFYLTMTVTGSERERMKRIESWRSGRWHYGASRYPGFDRLDTEAPRLHGLGRKLLGMPKE